MRPGGREPGFERDFLDGAERRARSSGVGFRELVTDRLTRAERSYGVDTYIDKGLLGILREIDEEAADLGGWPVLAALLANEQIQDDDTRVLAVTLLQEITAYGVHVHQLVKQLERVLRD